MDSRQVAEEIISRYHGAVADGNTLSVTIIKQSLNERITPAKVGQISHGGIDSRLTRMQGLQERMGLGPVRNGRNGSSVNHELLPPKGSR